jgi:hypothetical protein
MESVTESKECLAGDVESQLSVREGYIVLHSTTHTRHLLFKVPRGVWGDRSYSEPVYSSRLYLWVTMVLPPSGE